MRYKPSAFEQAKSDYSPLSKISNKGLTEEDKKEGNLKSVKNVGDKNEELLKVLSKVNKVSKPAKNKSDFKYDPKYAFYRFYRHFQKFKRMVLLDSKHGELKGFFKLLSAFKNHKPISNETKNCKNRILNNVNRIYKKYFGTYKTNYNK